MCCLCKVLDRPSGTVLRLDRPSPGPPFPWTAQAPKSAYSPLRKPSTNLKTPGIQNCRTEMLNWTSHHTKGGRETRTQPFSCPSQTKPMMLDFGQFDFGQLAEIELAEVEIGRSRTDGVCSVSSFSAFSIFFSFFFSFFSCSSSYSSFSFCSVFVPKNLCLES